MMPLYLTWQDVALRLALTFVASALLGLNREIRGHPAGLRTTILVGLAAAVAMIQANALLPLGGKNSSSFAEMDLMRLPLGCLTGVGFIGAGTIFRKGPLVAGITTAATLWMTTVIGLSLGGGQIGLGIAATVLGVGTLTGLKVVDERLARLRKALISIEVREDQDSAGIDALLAGTHYSASFRKSEVLPNGGKMLTYDVAWKETHLSGPPEKLIKAIHGSGVVRSFEVISGEQD